MPTISERLRDPEYLHGVPRKVKICAEAADTIDALVDALEGLCSEDIRERLLDAQQDINFHANTTMAQSVADASALIDEIDTLMSAGRAALAKAKAETRNEKEGE